VLRLLSIVLPAGLALVVATPIPMDPPTVLRRVKPEPVSMKGPESLWELGPSLARNSRVGAVVADTDRGILFRQNASEPHVLASVGKIYILIAYLDLIAQQQREPHELELAQMAMMIEESDNRSATELWDILGGPEGLAAFLDAKRLPQVERAEDDSWGRMRASAIDVSQVLASLYNGLILDERMTEFALDLMARVIDEQAWGVGVDRNPAIATYLKNGWFPEEGGWVVNSVGILVTGRERHYVVVLLTDSQSSFDEGVRLIESTVLLMRQYLR
jgi:hypothetical protein